MGVLTAFAKRIDERIAQADSNSPLESAAAARYMSEIESRRTRFELLAQDLYRSVIRPRMETFASRFSLAEVTGDPCSPQVCSLGYNEKRPVSTQLTLAVEHDTRVERVVVCYDVLMIPLFVKFNQHDKLTFLLDEFTEETVADWLEERLLEFLDAYLRVNRAALSSTLDLVVDPVCGMQVAPSPGDLQVSHLGHSYYFCSRACREMFTRCPGDFVRIKTM